MKTSDITDPLFREAVEAIDSGNKSLLQQMIGENPQLITMRLDAPANGYFKHPYLLWFVADNPIRHEKLPANIVEVTRVIIEALQKGCDDSYQFQLDYALGLICTGRIPKECGVQISLMDLLVNEGAVVKGGVLGPIGQNNMEAANYLLGKGAEYNLATAVGLDRNDDIEKLVQKATPSELYVALVVAAFFGKARIISFLIEAGADVNGKGNPGDFGGFHSHATALHQAVYAGSPESVSMLVKAGARLDATDTMYSGTPLEWAIYMQSEQGDNAEKKRKFAESEAYLRKYYG